MSPAFWLRWLAQQSHDGVVVLARSLPTKRNEPVAVRGDGGVLRVAQRLRIGGEEHVCSFANTYAACAGLRGTWGDLAATVRCRARELDVGMPEDLGLETYGELSELLCDVGARNVADLETLAARKSSLKRNATDDGAAVRYTTHHIPVRSRD